MPINNIEFIAHFIFANPGCTQVQVRRALCERNGKEYTSGKYDTYFSDRYRYIPGHTVHGKGYWELRDGGLYITEKGLTRLV
jgi:hypothetical protein